MEYQQKENMMHTSCPKELIVEAALYIEWIEFCDKLEQTKDAGLAETVGLFELMNPNSCQENKCVLGRLSKTT